MSPNFARASLCCCAFAVANCVSPCVAQVNSATRSIEIGLTPLALATAGFTEADSAALLSRIAEATTEFQALANARAAEESARQTLAEVQGRLAEEPLSQTWASAFTSAKEQLAAAQAAVASSAGVCRTCALRTVSLDRVALIEAVRSCPIAPAAPDLSVLNLSGSQWQALNLELAAQSRAIREGTAVAPSITAHLATLRSDPRSVAARQSLEANLASIQSVFESR